MNKPKLGKILANPILYVSTLTQCSNKIKGPCPFKIFFCNFISIVNSVHTSFNTNQDRFLDF